MVVTAAATAPATAVAEGCIRVFLDPEIPPPPTGLTPPLPAPEPLLDTTELVLAHEDDFAEIKAPVGSLPRRT